MRVIHVLRELIMNNLNLIIGDDKELVNFYLQENLRQLEFNEDDKITYDLSVNTLKDILDEASMMSLFSQTKVILGLNFNLASVSESDLTYLSNYISGFNKDAYIILLANKIDARTKAYKIFKEHFNIRDISKTDSKSDINKYAKDYLMEHGYKMDNYTLEYFLNKVGNNINNINLELIKLLNYKDREKVINQADIDLLIIDNIDNVIYEFTNAVFENDYSKISKMYADFKTKNLGFDYLLTSLFNSFHQALTIKILLSQGKNYAEIASYIGKKEFYVKKMHERLSLYTIQDLAKYLDKLAEIDASYKSGKVTTDMLEFFLLNKDW